MTGKHYHKRNKKGSHRQKGQAEWCLICLIVCQGNMFFSGGFHDEAITGGQFKLSFTCKTTGLKTNRERGVDGELTEWLCRSGDLVEL